MRLSDARRAAKQPRAASATERHPLATRIGAALETAGAEGDRSQAAVERQDADLVAARLERLLEGGPEAAELELGRTVAAREVGEVDRALRVHPPVERGYERLGDVADDPAAAGRAREQHGSPRFSDDGRCHRAPRPLAAGCPLATGRPAWTGAKAKSVS